MLFADADPSHQFVYSSPTLPCISSQRLHSTKDKMSIFGHPKKEVGQRTAAPERHQESRGALEHLAGQAQQKLLFLWKGFPFPSSKNSWQQHASSSFTGCSFLTRQARAAQGTRLSTAGKKPFLPMPTALALLSHIATAENLVLPNTTGSPSTCRILKAEATCAPIQRCTLTSPFKVAGSLVSLRLGSVDQNNQQVIITVFVLYVL